MITDHLYETLKKQLKKAKQPLTCNDLSDTHDVQQMNDVTTDDISNALAALWRRGLLERFTVHRGHGRGPRYSYALRKDVSIDTQHVTAAKSLNLDKVDVQQNEDGSVVLTTDRLVITVRPFTK